METESLQIRVHHPEARPTLVYLPGLHGDWTLIGGFREVLGNQVRFVEITYPRTLTWSLEDYAGAVEEELARAGIEEGWLLGESFGSQVVWPIVRRGKFKTLGVILAGGFVRHPMIPAVRFACRLAGAVPLALVVWVLFTYARLTRWRFRNSLGTFRAIDEFIARRTKLDQKAAQHRLRLVETSDPCAIARSTPLPIYALSGLIDPIVPWMLVRPWMQKHCLSLRAYRIIGKSDHNVLGAAAAESAEQVLRWMAADQGARVNQTAN